MRNAGYEDLVLNSLETREFQGENSGLNREQRELMEFLPKWTKRLAKSELKKKENKDTIAYLHIQIETMNENIENMNDQRIRFRDELAIEVKRFHKKSF